MCKKEKVTVRSLLKDVDKRAKDIQKQRVSENKALLKKEKEENLINSIKIGEVDYSADSKIFSLNINGKEEHFASRGELKRYLRMQYKGLGKKNNTQDGISFLPIIAIGFFLIGVGAFFMEIMEGITMALAAVCASIIVAVFMYIIFALVRSCLSGKWIFFPRYTKYVEKETKTTKAGITLTFFLFTIITTVITELTKKVVSSFFSYGTNKDVNTVTELNNVINADKVIGVTFVGIGFAMLLFAFFENELATLFTWLSSFVKFAKIETEDKPAEIKLEENKPSEPRERKDPTP